MQPGHIRLIVFGSTLASRSHCTAGDQYALPLSSHLLTFKMPVLGDLITAKPTQRIVGKPLFVKPYLCPSTGMIFGIAALTDTKVKYMPDMLWY